MLELIAKSKSGKTKTVSLKDVDKYMYDEALRKSPVEWDLENILKEGIFSDEDPVISLEYKDPSVFDTIKNLSDSAMNIFESAFNRRPFYLANKEFLFSEKETVFLRNALTEMEVELPDCLKAKNEIHNEINELIEIIKISKPGDASEVANLLISKLRGALVSGSLAVSDKLYLRSKKAIKDSVAASYFDERAEMEMELMDPAVSNKTKARIVSCGVLGYNFADNLLKDIRGFLDEKTKESLIIGKIYSSKTIEALQYANESLLKKMSKEWRVDEESWVSALKYCSPSESVIKSLFKVSEALPALASLGLITKDTVTEAMVKTDPLFYADFAWIRANEKLSKTLLSAIGKYEFRSAADKYIESGCSLALEKIIVEHSDKAYLASVFKNLSAECKVIAKEKILKDVKTSEAAKILSGLGEELSGKELNSIAKAAVKTIDGALSTLRNSESPAELRIIALKRILAADNHRKTVLRGDYKLSAEEKEIVLTYIQDKKLSYWDLREMDYGLLLLDQNRFKSQIKGLIVSGDDWNFSENVLKNLLPNVSNEIFKECLIQQEGNFRFISRVLGAVDSIGKVRLSEILKSANFKLTNFHLLENNREILVEIAKLYPFKGSNVLNGEFETKEEALSFLTGDIRTSGVEDLKEKALNKVLSMSPEEFSDKELERLVNSSRYTGFEDKVGAWASSHPVMLLKFVKERRSSGFIDSKEKFENALLMAKAKEVDEYTIKSIIVRGAEILPDYVLKNILRLSGNQGLAIDIMQEIIKYSEAEPLRNMTFEDFCMSVYGKMVSLSEVTEIFKKKDVLKLKNSDVLALEGELDAGMVTSVFLSPATSRENKIKAATLLADWQASLDTLLEDEIGIQIVNSKIQQLTEKSITRLIDNGNNEKLNDSLFEQLVEYTVRLSMNDGFICIVQENVPKLFQKTLERISASSLAGFTDLNTLMALVKDGVIDGDNAQKIKDAFDDTRVGTVSRATVKGKSLLIEDEHLAKKYNCHAILHDERIEVSTAIRRVVSVNSQDGSISAFVKVALVGNEKKLLVDIQDEVALNVVKNDNREINDLVKSKKKKAIKTEIATKISKDIKWTMRIEGRVSTNNRGYKTIPSFMADLKKAMVDAKKEIGASPANSPNIKKPQDTWSAPSRKGFILSPVMTGDIQMNEAEAVLDRINTEEVSEIVLEIGIKPLRKLGYTVVQAVEATMQEMENLFLVSGAFNKGSNVFGERNVDMVRVNASEDTLCVKLVGNFGPGQGVYKTISLIMTALSEVIQTAIKKEEIDLNKVSDEIERNLDLERILGDELQLKTLAGHKMLFAA